MQLFKKPGSDAPKRGDDENENDVATTAEDARARLNELDARIAAEAEERKAREQERIERQERERVRRARQERERQARRSCCGCCWG